MGKKWLGIGLLAILVLTLSSFGLGAKGVFKEDFEDGDVSDWQIWNYSDRLKMEVVDEGAGNSQKAFRISGSKGGDTAFKFTSPAFSVEGGKTYTLQMEAKHNFDLSKILGWGPAKDPARITWYDTNGVDITYTKIPGFDGPNTNWHKDVASNLTAPANAAKAKIQFGLDYPDIKPGQYWIIDNVMLME